MPEIPRFSLSTSLEPVVRHGTGRQTHLFGPSGAGNTCLARYCLKQLCEEAPHVRRQYINHCTAHRLPHEPVGQSDSSRRIGTSTHDPSGKKVSPTDGVTISEVRGRDYSSYR